jgi:DNA-binding SARP family transcriptional activator
MNNPEYGSLISYLSLEESTLTPTKQLQTKADNSTEIEAFPREEKANLKVLALGEPQVLRDALPITRWRMARAMELCFFLLDSKEPMRKEQIITALWQEVDDQVDQTFRSTIYYLKKTIGAHFVLGQSGAYRLDKTLIWYDVAAFLEHQARSRAALAQKNLFAAREDLLKMVELYRGDYVQSFYSDWCSLRRDSLRQAYLEARHELAKICWQLKWFEECIMHWQHMLAIDSCLEDPHYGLMRCYLKQGKRDLALRQYQRCSTIMHDELGIMPGPVIQNLYQRLVKTGT